MLPEAPRVSNAQGIYEGMRELGRLNSVHGTSFQMLLTCPGWWGCPECLWGP